MKHWCVRHNQACDYANSNGDCNVSACQTVIGEDRKMTNREWLATLTDKEFAKWHVEIGCGSCAHNPGKGICFNLRGIISFNEVHCIDGIVKWMSMEHKED